MSSYDSFANAPKLLDSLRLVTALENLLGSLGPQITAMMSRALTLENKRAGSSNVILQDPNSAAVLELTKEKLAGQIVAGKLTYIYFATTDTSWLYSNPRFVRIQHEVREELYEQCSFLH